MLNFNDASLFRGSSNNVPLINVADPQQASNPNISINPVAVNTGNPDYIPYTSSPEFLAMIQANADQMAAGGTPQTQLQSLSGGMKTSEPNFNVSGLFSPELSNLQARLYQQKQNEAMQDRFTQFAQLTPLQQASVGFQQAGYQLGQGIGGALGGQDPQLQMIGLTQQIAQNTDLSNPQSIYQAAQKFAQIGNLPLATAYADRAKVLQESLAKTGKEAAEAVKITQETTSKTQTVKALMDKFQLSNVDATAIASNPDLLKSYLTPKSAQGFKLLETGKYTPESIAKWTDEGGDLEPIDKMAKPDGTFLAKAQQLRIGVKAKFGDYTPEEVGKINKALELQRIEEKQAGAMAIKIPLGDVLDKVYLSKDREDAAKNWGLAGEAYKLTVPMIDKLNKVESTIGNAFTGAGADAKLSIAKGLSAVGVKISDKATDTEIANAISAQVVQQIAKVFPGSQSNKELEQLVKSKFNVQQELPTILRLIRQARDEMLSQKITYEQGAKLPDSERTKFNANLAQGQNYMKIQQYRDLEEKYRKGTISESERATAASIKTELGL
jgi:hypothetical protein